MGCILTIPKFLLTQLFSVNFVAQKTFEPSEACSLCALRRVTESVQSRLMDPHVHAHTHGPGRHYTDRPVQSVRKLMTQILHSPTNST